MRVSAEEEEEEKAVFISVVNTNEDPPTRIRRNQVQDASGQGKARQEHKSHEPYAHAGHSRQEGQGRQSPRREPPRIPKHT